MGACQGGAAQNGPGGGPHGRLAARALARLFVHVEADRLGVVYGAETGFLIARDPDTVRAPGVAFVSRERLEQIGEPEGFVPGAPDLVIEVIPPSDRYTDVLDKVLDWQAAGARLVILINPRRRTVTAFRSRDNILVLNEDETLDAADVVSGWTLSLQDLFRG
ncbi:MAG TPA: Uma2 family endonuclease [Dehalococcoidia bacterium]|nr:Uma2 family endonuclease [Dehalococcoidia bacterium]